MDGVQVQVGVPFAVGLPDEVRQQLLNVLKGVGIEPSDGPAGPGNVLFLVTQSVDVSLADDLLQQLEAAINAITQGAGVIGPANVITAAPTSAPAPPSEGPFDTSAQGIENAMQQAASETGVPLEALQHLWRWESGSTAGEFQRTVSNPEGFGGYFGLPRSMLGSPLDQARAAANILVQQYANFHNWKSAICAYNVGPHGDFSQSHCVHYTGPQ